MKSILNPRFSLSNGQLSVNILSDISLTFNSGDRVAIIGPNGSGKTTFLRLISGILAPTSGKMTIDGRVFPLLSAGIGVEELATGYENIRLILLHLGVDEVDIDHVTSNVEEFCELGDFIHMPFNTYSAGMRTRLIFGSLTCMASDIVAMDEVISTGDLLFHAKAKRRFNQFFEKIKLVVTATHDLNWAQENCNKAVLLMDGKVVKEGRPEDVVATYSNYEKVT